MINRSDIRNIASYGRNGDSTLMHVNPREVHGLASLGAVTGRPLTINPTTGLPEAFSFYDILPMLAGIATTAMGAGPIGAALASGLTAGAKTAIQGGGAGDILTSAAVSGVGSYAGSSLFDAGMAGLPPPVEPGAAAGLTISEAATRLPESVTAAQAEQLATAAAKLYPEPYTAAQLASNVPVPPIASTRPPTFLENFQNIPTVVGQNVEKIASDPLKFGEGVVNEAIKKPFLGLAAAAPFMGLGSYTPPVEKEKSPIKLRENFGQPVNSTFTPMPEGYNPAFQGGWDYNFQFAKKGGKINSEPGNSEMEKYAYGGLSSLNGDERRGTTKNIINEATAALLGEHPKPKFAIQQFIDTFGNGALNVLKNNIGGGRVKGSGGGLDDLIGGTIEGKQQVRLADGEFVVPADVVSGIGDGSTDQGVRKLHKMMADIREDRTGKTTQPGRLNYNKVMPV